MSRPTSSGWLEDQLPLVTTKVCSFVNPCRLLDRLEQSSRLLHQPKQSAASFLAENHQWLDSAMPNSYPTILPGLRRLTIRSTALILGPYSTMMRCLSQGHCPEGGGGARSRADYEFRLTLLQLSQNDYAALEAETLKGRSDEELLSGI